MAVLNVKVKNYKKFKDLSLVLDGKNIFFCGDSGTGKSTILELIEAANMQKGFPEDPLSEGADAGAVQIGEEIDGVEYNIFRKFKKGDNGRWEIRTKDGAKPAKPLSKILEDVLGRALKNAYFDYHTYFFGLKSSEARYKYFVDHIGGEEVDANNKAITQKKKERAALSNQRMQQEAIYLQMGTIDKDELPKLYELYKKEKTSEDAESVYNEVLLKKVDTTILEQKIDDYQSALEAKSRYLQTVEEADAEIERLEDLLKRQRDKKSHYEAQAKNITLTQEDMDALVLEKSEIDQQNIDIKEEADAAYKDEIDKVIIFNSNRKTFIDSIKALKEFTRVDEEWNTLDKEIDALQAENSELFKAKLPIPELTVSSVEKTNKDGEIEIKETIMYNGREFCFDQLSKGESIEIAVKIQKALNPKGNNFIVLPEANLLGSKLDDIIAECKKQNIQALVEVTQRKQDFKIVFEEEFLNG